MVMNNFSQQQLLAELERLKAENAQLKEQLSAKETLEGRLDRRYQRERRARKEAERIMEERSLELFNANQQLSNLNKAQEQVLNERTHQLRENIETLERVNKEIKQFTYLASHDLKTPLRAIGSLIGFIEDDLSHHPEIRNTFQDCIDLIKIRVNRMHRLLNAILEYSNIGKYKKHVETVYAKDIVEEVMSSITLPIGFKIELKDNLFFLNVNRNRLYQIFRHIVENAIKYHHNPSAGLITISSTQGEDKCTISIRDNGPGIATKYHERIFKIFQTLETKDKNKESIGIGLPIVKKIVEEEMNGIITFDSDAGRGTNFIIEFPTSILARF